MARRTPRSTSAIRPGLRAGPRGTGSTSCFFNVVICSHLSTEFSRRPPSPRASEHVGRRRAHRRRARNDDDVVRALVPRIGRDDEDRPPLVHSRPVEVPALLHVISVARAAPRPVFGGFVDHELPGRSRRERRPLRVVGPLARGERVVVGRRFFLEPLQIRLARSVSQPLFHDRAAGRLFRRGPPIDRVEHVGVQADADLQLSRPGHTFYPTHRPTREPSVSRPVTPACPSSA